MANKETYRTINKLCLLNYCTIIVIITLHLSLTLATETKEETPQNVTSIENNSTFQTPVAEPLIRFRRQPPRTIVKRIVRPKRYKMKRVKRPKIKYSFAEPPPTYYSRKPFNIKKPTLDTSIFEDFSHMNVESADFDLPPSSYEAQSMDLDLYKHYEPAIEAASYKEIQKPSFYTYDEPESTYKEPSYTEISKSPSYTYSAVETSKPTVTYSYASTKPRKPHTKYGVPTELVYSTGYDNKYTYDAPASKPAYTEVVENPFYDVQGKHEYSYKKPFKETPRIPATRYGVPDVHIPATGSIDYNKYSVVEQKPPYASHAPTKIDTYHFAEPPEPEPSVDITYSPSYEINIPSPQESHYSEGKYGAGRQPQAQYPPHAQHPPPAQHAPPSQHPPSNYDEPRYQEQPQYEEPPQQYQPPTHYQPTNSYERPPQEHYEDTAPSHQDVSDTNQPASYQPAPASHQTIDTYIPPSQDLPINVNHKQPSYDFPKSSYEVPIYDPIPFDASNQQEREVYPPQIFDQSNRLPSTKQSQAPPNYPPEQGSALEESLPNDVQSSSDTNFQTNAKRPQSPINHLRRTRKRKRTNKNTSTTVSTTIHILDVPELEEAFDKENRNKYVNSREPDANESQKFESINKQNNLNDNYSKGPWNPMKIRTAPIIFKSTPSTISTINTLGTKNKRYHYKQQRTATTTTTTTTTEAPTKVEIISIEKSRSKTYFDGVVSTPRIYNTNLFRNRFRFDNTSTSTTPLPHVKAPHETNFSKRTTKNIFDTTIFKSPLNDSDDVHRNLPKNHKLF